MSKVVVYQMLLKATKKDEKFSWEIPSKDIEDLFLGIDWQGPFQRYNLRSRFYWGFSISGSGEEAYPVLEGKLELSKPSLDTPEFTLEVACVPSKLEASQREMLHQSVEKFLTNEDFKIWWEDDPRGPRKRPLNIKQQLLNDLKKLKAYNGSDDMKLEDVTVSIKEALQYFGYEANTKPKEVAKSFKKKLKELQVKAHPDSDSGSEDSFIYLQKCRKVVEVWLKR